MNTIKNDIKKALPEFTVRQNGSSEIHAWNDGETIGVIYERGGETYAVVDSDGVPFNNASNLENLDAVEDALYWVNRGLEVPS